jgi:hypothetical protein
MSTGFTMTPTPDRRRVLGALACLALQTAGTARGAPTALLGSAGESTPNDPGDEDEPATATDQQQTASISFTTIGSDGKSIGVDSAFLPDGGFVAIHGEEFIHGGFVENTLAVSNYLEPGLHEPVIPFDTHPSVGPTPADFKLSQRLTAVLHRDTNGDERFDFAASDGEVDGPYTADGAPVADDSFVMLDPLAQPVYWQLDFIAGMPYERLGPDSGNPFYAAPSEDRLFRYGFGQSEAGLVDLGSAWPSADLRQCVDPRHFEDHDNGTVSITFTVSPECDDQRLTLAIYEKLGYGFDPSRKQVLLAHETDLFGPGTHTLRLELPFGARVE